MDAEFTPIPKPTFIYGLPHCNGRENVREPIVPYITLPLHGTNGDQAEMHLRVNQCIELSQLLLVEVSKFIQRKDISDALRRNTPGSVI